MSWTLEGVTKLIEVLLYGGAGVMLREFVQYFLKKKVDSTPTAKRAIEQGIIEKSLLNISRSNDELTEDITRVRKALTDEQMRAQKREDWWQHRWDAREDRWNAREAAMQAEIDTMRQKMVDLIGELDALRVKLQTHYADQ